MSLEENKAFTRRLYDEMLGKKNEAILDEVLDSNFVDHSPFPGQDPGIEGTKKGMREFLNAFPDLSYDMEFQVSEGDMVVSRLTVRGTHKGEMAGIPPTGKQISMKGIDAFRVKDGKIVERWGNFDDLGMMQQLGAVPAPGQQ